MRKINIYKLFFIACLASVLLSCKDKKPAGQTPPPVAVIAEPVWLQLLTYYDEYPAMVVALNEVQLHAQVAGYITDIHFVDGQQVKKGQLLYTIDQQQYRGAYDEAVANLSVAKANLEKEKQDSVRYASLMEKDAIARQTYDYAMASLLAAKMQVASARANVQSVQTALKYSTITAPLTGTIGISQVRLGAAVQPGQTVLNTVSIDSPIGVDFAIDQKDISRFNLLLKSSTNGTDSTFTLVLPDGTLYSQQGLFLLLDRAVNRQTGTVTARVEFDNAHGLLKSGMTCKLRVTGSSASPQLVIPYRAVTEQMGEYFVFVVKDGKVSQAKLKLGRIAGALVVVQSGLAEGDVVVTEGMQKLRNGAEVSVAKPDSTIHP